MATLFNTKIKDTYQSLLKLEDNTILTTTTKNVTDGLGNASPLYMSTTRIGIGTNAPTTTLDVNGSATVTGNLFLTRLTSYYGVSSVQPIYIHTLSYLLFDSGGPESGSISRIDIRHNFVGSSFNGILIQPTINQTIYSGITRGVYINPVLTAATDFRAIETVRGNVILGSTSGNVMIGTTTDAGYKLDVNGTLRSGIIYLTSNNGKIQYATDIYMQFPAQGGPIAGVFADGGYGWNFNSTQTYSTLRPGNGTTTPATWSLSQSVKSFGRNTFYITTDLTNASGASSVGETITLLNVNLNGPTAPYAYKPSLKLKAGNSGTHSGADQYARSGDLYLESGDANSGTATDVAGGTIYLNSGRGTGTGTPGSIIFSTATATTSGTTLQTLSERMRIDGNGNVGIGTSSPTNPLDVAFSPGRLISFQAVPGYADSGQIVFSNATSAGIVSSGTIGLGPGDTNKTVTLGNGITSKITTPGSTKYDCYGNQTPSTLAGTTNRPVLFTSTIPDGCIDGFIFENISSGSRNLFKLIQNNTTLLTVNPNGNLLLGTTTDNGAKLRIESGDLSLTGYQPVFNINGTSRGRSYIKTDLAIDGTGVFGGIGMNTDIWLTPGSGSGGYGGNIPATIHFKVNGTNPLTSTNSHWWAGDAGKAVGYQFLTTHYNGKNNFIPTAWFGPEISGGIVGLQQFNIGYEPKPYAGAGFTFVGVGLSGVVTDPFTRNTEFNPIRIDYSLASGGSNITARGIYYNPTFTSVYPLLVNNAFESTSGSLVMSGAASRVSSGIGRGAYFNQTLRPTNMSGDILVGLDINPTFTSSATQISTFTYTAGSGYTGSGQVNFTNIPLTGGTGTGATVNITMGVGNVVTAVTIANRGTGYTVNDVLTLPAQNIFTHQVEGSGFSVTVTAVGASTYDTYGLLVRAGKLSNTLDAAPTGYQNIHTAGNNSLYWKIGQGDKYAAVFENTAGYGDGVLIKVASNTHSGLLVTSNNATLLDVSDDQGGIYSPKITSGSRLSWTYGYIEHAGGVGTVIYGNYATPFITLREYTGNVLINTSTDAGERLQVNGTARVSSTLQLDNGAITWGNFSGAPTSRLRITRRTGYGVYSGIEIGALNTNTSAFASTPIVIGDMNTLADVGTVILGFSNNIQKDQSLVVGSGNSIPVVTGVTTSKQIILGDGNIANAYTNGQVPGIIVGLYNTQNSFAFSQMYGTGLKPYANNQLLFGANAGPVNPSIKEVYIGYGYRNEIDSVNQDNGNGNNLLISPSHASNAADKNGGNLTLAASRGTGAGTPGNLIFATATATTTGTTLQTLNERMRINGSGNVMINTTTDNGYRLNVNGTAFVSELITTGGIVKHNPYTPGIRALEIYSGIGHLGNTGVWASMYSTGVYGNGWDPYYGTQGVGVAGDPNNNSDGGSVLNIGVYGGAALSNATGVYGTSGLFGKAANLRNASAALEVNSTTHGFLPPRMTAAQRSALNTITGFGVITGGSGYVDGTYRTVSITGGSGQNAYARIVISGGSVTSVTLDNSTLGGLAGGFGYTNGASVSASNTQLGGTGAGFSVIINASTPVGMMVYQTDATEGLYIYKSTGWTFIA